MDQITLLSDEITDALIAHLDHDEFVIDCGGCERAAENQWDRGNE